MTDLIIDFIYFKDQIGKEMCLLVNALVNTFLHWINPKTGERFDA